ncbi:MAG: trimethylamine methyltransferase family protein [Victivallaceae bacterium]|nr:trimethylamine methyltransferase family protein [Victivallaceae bacterium]
MLRLKESFKVLSPEDCQKIYQTALKILKKVGVKFENSRLLEAYKSNFALEADTNGMVKFPEKTVEDILERARTDYMRNYTAKTDDVIKPIKFAMGYCCTQIIDMDSNAIRLASKSDLDDACILGDAISEFCSIPPLFFPQDVSLPNYALHALEVLLKRVDKNKINYSIGEAGNAKYIKEMYNTAYNGEMMNMAHRFLMSPLVFDDISMKIIYEYHDLDMPVRISSGMVVPGASGPVSLAGSLALTIAEDIACMPFNLIYAKGRWHTRPCIGLTFLDQKTGQSCYSGPDALLCALAANELNDYLGFPDAGRSGANADICISNFQAGAEKMFDVMTKIYTGFPFIYVCGRLGPGHTTGSLPQVIMDWEAGKMINFFLKGLEVNDGTLAFDLIKKVGPGGSYLSEEHTAEYFRSEVWLPEIFQRIRPDGNKEKTDFVAEAAKEKVKTILKAHDPHYLSEDQEKELAKIVKRADMEMGMS